MNIVPLKQKTLVLGVATWLLLFVILSVTHFNAFQVLNIVGFLFLIVVPGYLTVSALQLASLEMWGQVGLTVAFSVLELMVVPLIGNTLLPFLGVAYPLAQPVLLVELTLLVGGLLATIVYRKISLSFTMSRFVIFDTYQDLILAIFPTIFVVMSVLGAIRLNNGATSIFTLIMLIGMGIYSAFLMYKSDEVGPNVIPVALFFLASALLLMTSLRGWLITGHDIQREFRVFELTKNTGAWVISNFRDAYNACLSITILPTVFSNLLRFSNPYVYKVFFQLIFATVPGVIYLTTRRYVSSALALLATFYFISFPTFFTDMPFLNRQEIAFLFLMAMFYVLFSERLTLMKRRAIFLVLGIAMVLSHYSTTYTVVIMLLFLLMMRPLVHLLGRWIKNSGWFTHSAFAELDPAASTTPLITVWMVAVLVAASFLWSSVLTDTASGSITRVITRTFAVILNNTKEEGKSNAVLSYTLFSWQRVSPSAVLQDYEKNVVEVARNAAPIGTYYLSADYSKYTIDPVAGGALSITGLGKIISSIGVNPTTFNTITRLASAKILQLLIVIGLFALLYTGPLFKRKIETEYVLLGISGVLMMASQVILPVLSVEYGVMRAFQQSLLFLGLFIVVGSMFVVGKFGKKIQVIFASILALFFFTSITGISTQLLGGYDPQLHLNNGGQYYDTFYLHASEAAGIKWLAQAVGNNTNNDYQSEVQTDRFALSRVNTLIQVNTLNDIFPGLIRRGSFIYLGYANVTKLQANISYNDTAVAYHYPIQFLDDNKSLVYNNGGSKIYR